MSSPLTHTDLPGPGPLPDCLRSEFSRAATVTTRLRAGTMRHVPPQRDMTERHRNPDEVEMFDARPIRPDNRHPHRSQIENR